MLTETAYFGALIIYTLSALLAIVLMNFWLLASRSPGVKLMLSLPLLSLLLTPAFIQAQADTFAPALVVVAFQWLSHGQEAAAHALRPLLLFTGVALGLGVVLALIVHWLGRRAAANEAKT